MQAKSTIVTPRNDVNTEKNACENQSPAELHAQYTD